MTRSDHEFDRLCPACGDGVTAAELDAIAWDIVLACDKCPACRSAFPEQRETAQ